MKTLIASALFISFSAFADFSSVHEVLCPGDRGNCQIILAPKEVPQISQVCQGKLADISCRVMMLKTSDSATMNLSCGDEESPLLTQVLSAEVLSYNVASVKGERILNDPNDYHLFSNPALSVHLSSGEKLKAQMVLTLQERSITLSDVICE